MSNDKKQRLLEISITTVKALLYIMLVFNAFVFVFFGLIDRSHVMQRDPVQFVLNWTVTTNDSGNQVMTNTLPQNLEANEYIYFETRNTVSVYIDGELRDDFIEERDVNQPGGSFRRFLMSVALNEADSGKEIMIVRPITPDVDQEVPNFFVGTRFGALSYLLRTSGIQFVLAFIVLIFSFVAFVVSIVLSIMYRQRIDMMYGALAIFSIASWLITDSSLFCFIFRVYHVDGLLSFIFCLMMPLPLAIFMTSIQRGRYKGIRLVVMLISILNAVVWPFLHFAGIIPFYRLIDPANLVLVILAALGLFILILDAIKGHTVTYRYTFIGFIGFLVGCLIELTVILLDISIIREAIPMVTGLGFLLTFIVIQQVNDLRKMNMEKQHAIDISEAKTRFLASMSHEIRTPINAILGMNEMILRENNEENIAEYSRNIKTSGNMLLMLVNDVLDFTKIEAGKLEIREADFRMADMLYDVISLINERAEEKSLGLKVDITDEVPNKVNSDEFRIRQILVNLMNNAVKYTEKGSINLKVGGSYTEDGYMLSLTVKDTGKGIRKEDQEHLFEAFSRADLKTNANIEGTGLGLAIVKSIVDSMNGELGVESEYGVGSEFWVKLPIKYKDKKPIRSDFLERHIEQATEKDECIFTAPDAKILAVDDNQSNLTIVKLFLKRNGIVPDLCSSGTKAIELCKEKKYDLILLDHMMPAPDGIETLHIIREDKASLNKDTKALVLTANAVAGSRDMYLSEGFDDYLTKPLDAHVLEETVKSMLPQEKVFEAPAAGESDNAAGESEASDDEILEFPAGSGAEEEAGIKSGFADIEGLDYELALSYCAGEEELLKEIVADIAKEAPERAKRMRESLEAKDIKAYEIDAHTIKSSVLTIGLRELSARAKKHEFAAKDNDTDFIYEDADGFINEYTDICKKLSEV